MVVLVAGLDLPTRLVEWPIILLITTLAVVSVKLGWRAPMAHHLAPVLERPVAVVRRVARPGRADPSDPSRLSPSGPEGQ
jgi:hypothetical protein